MRSHHFAAAVLALALTAGCEASDRPGTIVGQLFVVLQSGNSAPMDVRPVRLVPESARLDSTLSVLCIQRDREVAKLSVVAAPILPAASSCSTLTVCAPSADPSIAKLGAVVE